MILLYDGSFRGLLSCLFEAYLERGEEVRILRERGYQPGLFDRVRKVESRDDLASRVVSGIRRKISPEFPHRLLRAFLTEAPGAEDTILACVRKGMENGWDLTGNLADLDILRLEKLARRCDAETHLFKGILRFRRLKETLFYAPMEPDGNILPLLGDHFIRRLGDQDWIIHDLRRNTALVYRNRELEMGEIILDAPPGEPPAHDREDETFELWRTYYRSIAIADRRNPRLRMQFLPRKYWRHLPEMAGEAGR